MHRGAHAAPPTSMTPTRVFRRVAGCVSLITACAAIGMVVERPAHAAEAQELNGPPCGARTQFPIAEDPTCVRNTTVGPCTDVAVTTGNEYLEPTAALCGFRPSATGIPVGCGLPAGTPSADCP